MVITVATYAPNRKMFDAKLLLIASERGLAKMFVDNLTNLEGILLVNGVCLGSRAL